MRKKLLPVVNRAIELFGKPESIHDGYELYCTWQIDCGSRWILLRHHINDCEAVRISFNDHGKHHLSEVTDIYLDVDLKTIPDEQMQIINAAFDRIAARLKGGYRQ